MDDIEKAINGQTGATGPAGASGASGATGAAPTEEEVRRQQALADLSVIEANKKAALADLQKARLEKRQLKKESQSGPSGPVEKVIDEADPDAQAWLKKIHQTVSPVQDELDKEKAEIRQFSLDEFLADKPSLAKNPDKLKEVLSVYDKIKTASERTTQGVLLDLRKAYAAVFQDELLEADRQNRVEGVRRDAAFSEAGISRGSTAYSSPKETRPKLTAEEEKLAVRWYGSIETYAKVKAEQDKKLEEAV
jgi:hypothetical protein